MDEKRCYGACKQTLPLTEFTKNRSREDGLHNECRACKKARALAYASSHRVQEKARAQAWREANAEQHRAYTKAWNAAHPLEKAALGRLSYARRKGVTVFGDIPLTIESDLVALYGPYCLYPGCEETKLTFDHIVPVGKDGSHAVENFQLLCAFHNNSKHDRTIDYRPKVGPTL